MIPTLFKRRSLLLIITAGCVVTAAAWAVSSSVRQDTTSSDNTPSIPPQTASTMRARQVFIEGFEQYEEEHDHLEAHGSIQNTLYTYVSKGKPDLYTGTIREKSFKKTSEKTAEILIDIEPARVTYKIGLLNPSDKGYKPFSIACAPKNQQANPDSECIDGGMPR